MSAESSTGWPPSYESEPAPLPHDSTIHIFGSYDGKITFEVWGPNDECIALAHAATLHEALAAVFSINESRTQRGDNEMDLELDTPIEIDSHARPHTISKLDGLISCGNLSLFIDRDDSGQPRVTIRRLNKPPATCSAPTLVEAMDEIWAQIN